MLIMCVYVIQGMTFGCIYHYQLKARTLTLPLSGCAPRCNTTTVQVNTRQY